MTLTSLMTLISLISLTSLISLSGLVVGCPQVVEWRMKFGLSLDNFRRECLSLRPFSQINDDFMAHSVDPKQTTRAFAYEFWMKAPNPMVTFIKTLDVTRLVKVSKRKELKFNMLLDWCIGKAAVPIKEFYMLPVGEELMQYDSIAVNTIVKNRRGEVSSCDILFDGDLEEFNKQYLQHTSEVAASCQDRDLSTGSMVIGTSAIIDTEIDGAIGMNSGIFNNPFIIWGRYKRRFFRYYLTISFQFHHTQMDGAHAGRFLTNLQNEISGL